MATTTTQKSKSSEPSISDLASQIEQLKSDLSGLTTTIKDVGLHEANRAAEHVKARGELYREAGQEKLDELRRTAEGYGEDAAKYVKQQPGQALGLAAAVGFIIGFLMSGRR